MGKDLHGSRTENGFSVQHEPTPAQKAAGGSHQSVVSFLLPPFPYRSRCRRDVRRRIQPMPNRVIGMTIIPSMPLPQPQASVA